ncbi:CRISPR-associated protein, Crm2 family [Chloroherpeton thalassium ATCC 35110]|uniref:CRISPR-associated protein, Crm2 family n=1 Tax=Chloroherpeton thalassium (strain ATCC 35110 / GB-78) TaxID=517418 RepID=B3QXD8_CHLT3|nr:type III-B CRISPR-associated protein Cas10/Cmr2 [Chloroherpeton thalassium]ACF13412.1 CRISPR-associated protein, Crm2 family [Chloroherpeton thalassium ATCC 35110]
MSKSEYLFLFTVGPVQSFIAQARKTRDLYAGSAILGEIVDAAIRCVGSDNIIVPDAKSVAKPNRFLAKIYAANALEARKIGAAVEKTAQAKWMEIANEAFENAQVKIQKQSGSPPVFKGTVDILTDSFVRETSALQMLNTVRPCEATSQIQNHLEIYWVAVELNGDYKEKHDELQKLLGAIKNTRQFTQIDEPAGRKCSLDGERNALFYRPGEKDKRPYFIQNGAQQVDELLTPGEALSAVSLVKRFFKKGDQKKQFPSTPRIALLHVIDEIEKSDEGKKFRDLFETSFDELDEQLYYEESLNEAYFRKNGYDEQLENISEIKAQQGKIKERFGKQMTKYYAILVFDGDNMGKIWSGKGYLKELDKLENFQKALAAHLGEYAKWAKDYLSEPKGKTVYTGGDDFLGFVNLNYLFVVMKELRAKYDEEVNQKLRNYFVDGKQLTFTAGVAIAHYKEPLSVVLGDARAAEKAAKEAFKDDGKDAFALSVLKHSGEARRCLFKWQTGRDYLTDNFSRIVEKLKDKQNGFSNTFIKNIDREFRPLMDVDRRNDTSRIDSAFDESFEKELKRLLMRSKNSANATDSEINILFNSVNFLKDCSETPGGHLDAENFFSALHIAEFIKRQLSDDD